jgi:hypothetical protein
VGRIYGKLWRVKIYQVHDIYGEYGNFKDAEPVSFSAATLAHFDYIDQMAATHPETIKFFTEINAGPGVVLQAQAA